MEIISNIEVPGPHQAPLLTDILYTIPREPRPIIIFCHGFKGFKDWGAFNLAARYFAQKKFIFVKFNFSFNGTTPQAPADFADLEAFGHNNYSRELEELGTIIDWVHTTPLIPDHYKNLNEIYLVGHSRGGGTAILKAAEDSRIKKLATWAAVSDFGYAWTPAVIKDWQKNGVMYVENARTHQRMPLYYQLYEDYIQHQNRLDIKKATASLHIPFLLVHGSEDSSVSLDHALQLKKANQDIKLDIIPSGNHTFGTYHPYNEQVLPFDMQIVLEHTYEFFKD